MIPEVRRLLGPGPSGHEHQQVVVSVDDDGVPMQVGVQVGVRVGVQVAGPGVAHASRVAGPAAAIHVGTHKTITAA
jgi:hypothetical protein